MASPAIADTAGRVVDGQTREPIAGATVYGDTEATAITGADGAFVLAGPTTTLTVISDAHDPRVIERVRDGLVIALVPSTGEVIEVAGDRPARAAGAVTLDRAKLNVIPGSRGDVLTGIKNLPGIANNGSLTPLSSGLIIRGSSPESSRILVDGFEIPVLYHFLGVQSVLPTEMLSDLEYLPGDQAQKILVEVMQQPQDIVAEFGKYIKFGE